MTAFEIKIEFNLMTAARVGLGLASKLPIIGDVIGLAKNIPVVGDVMKMVGLGKKDVC